jgi:predicted phosphodiesterase
MPARLLARGWRTELAPTSTTDTPPLIPGSVTLVALPDTQYYADCRSPHLAAQTKWIGEQAAARNIQAVVTLGDLTEHNIPAEWEYVSQAYALAASVTPLVLVTGNHDEGHGGSADVRGPLVSK